MKRRSVLRATLPLLMARPGMLSAQAPARSVKVGFLLGAAPDSITTRTPIEPFVRGPREGGFAEGRNLVIDYRWAEGKPERLPGLIAALLARGCTSWPMCRADRSLMQA
jgi:putative ABC transport system substrate-binding protein